MKQDVLKNITIVLITYKSTFKLKTVLKKIPKEVEIIIVDNSKDFTLKKILTIRKNIKIYYTKNNGYGASINYAVKKINTPYFLVLQPDVEGINEKSLYEFYSYSKKLNDKFSVIGPHFRNSKKSGHYQTSTKHKIKSIKNVHGSVMFFNKKIFQINNGFDDNFFLYWEETDYTKRCKKKGYLAYQLNTVKIKHLRGKSVKMVSFEYQNRLKKLYTWHFIWSKIYYFKKHYGIVFALIYFFPLLIRLITRIVFYKIFKSKKIYHYYFRLNGLITSFLGRKSYMRLENIN